MSYIGARTKKVTTYGKKRTGVVSLYTDDTALTPVKVTHSSTSASTSTPTTSPIRPKRAPLKSKHSTDDANVPIPILPSKGHKKGSKSKLAPEDQAGYFLDDYGAVKKTSSTKRTEKTVKRKERSATKDRSLSASRTSTVTEIFANDVIEVAEDLSSISLADIPISTDHAADYDRLLASVTIPQEHNFTEFLSSPAVISLLAPGQQAAGPAFKKIGEASYSEVFALSIKDEREIVVKVIPLFDHHATSRPDEMPDTSYPGDVLRELEITSRMSQMPGGGFVDFHGSYIAKGRYPQVLIDEWWAFKRSLGSASVCPDIFGQDQRYALIVLSDGGLDLEAFKFDAENGWTQAAGVFWQTVAALARAEEWTSFEHRDLHEGQILISATFPQDTIGPVNYLSPESTGAKATIIDFGLSRLDLPDHETPVWSSFPPEVYEGKGEQWDVYRSLRDTIGSDWSGYHPKSNVLWLKYLLRYLLHRKKTLRKPKFPTATRARRARAPRKSDVLDEAVVKAYACLIEAEGKLSSQELGGMTSANDLLTWAKSSGYLL